MRFRRVGKLPGLLALIAAVLLTAAAPAYAAGELDPSFGAGAGVVSTSIAPTPSGFNAGGPVLVLPSGKIIVAGTDGRDLVLVRYLSDGTEDSSTFGTSGIARITAPVGCGSGYVA